MREKKIIKEIEYILKESNTEYSNWTIGITDNPERRRKEHRSKGEDTASWVVWKADNVDIARTVEEFFIEKGMNNSVSQQGNTNIIYIF